MNTSNLVAPNTPPSPATDDNAMRFFYRPRFQTEETLRAGNGGYPSSLTPAAPAHHIHTMSEENPFLPTDDEKATDDDDDDKSEVSSVSNDSMKRYQNWIQPLTPEAIAELEKPFVPPQEIVVMLKITNETSVPDWLQTPLRDPSPHGPPQAAFAHPLLSQQNNSYSPVTAHPLLRNNANLSRNMSWGTETTLSSSFNLGAPPSPPLLEPVIVDRPRRSQPRGFSQPFLIGDLVGQSSFAGQQDSVSAPTTASSSLSFSGEGESFSHTRRANRRLDELVAEPIRNIRRNNPLKEEVLYVFDKFSGPVKRMVKTHRRCKSYELQASEHGCLA